MSYDDLGLDVAFGEAGDRQRPEDVRAAVHAVLVAHVPLAAVVDQVARAAAQRPSGHASYVSRTLADRWQPHSSQTPARLRSQVSQAFQRSVTTSGGA